VRFFTKVGGANRVPARHIEGGKPPEYLTGTKWCRSGKSEDASPGSLAGCLVMGSPLAPYSVTVDLTPFIRSASAALRSGLRFSFLFTWSKTESGG
jgi:hypothetical protein